MYPPCLTQIYVRDSFFSAHFAFAILFPLSSIYLLTYTAGIISLLQAIDCFKFPIKNVAKHAHLVYYWVFLQGSITETFVKKKNFCKKKKEKKKKKKKKIDKIVQHLLKPCFFRLCRSSHFQQTLNNFVSFDYFFYWNFSGIALMALGNDIMPEVYIFWMATKFVRK